jgi:hypothetical protein
VANQLLRVLLSRAVMNLCFFFLYGLHMYFCFMCFGCGLLFDVISIVKQVCLSRAKLCLLFDVISITICVHVYLSHIHSCYWFDVINIRKHVLVCHIFIHVFWSHVLCVHFSLYFSRYLIAYKWKYRLLLD